MRQRVFSSLDEVFATMRECSEFIILRNYEELSNETYYMNGYDDINFLCASTKEMKRELGVQRDIYWKSPNHFFINIKGSQVKIGLHYVGDGYYDIRWEKAMIESRVSNGSYDVMNDENYFYSLIYHALLQKRQFSDEYRRRLTEMGKGLGIDLQDKVDFYECLFKYMKEKGYKVDYPQDPTVPINYGHVSEEILTNSFGWKTRRLKYKVKMKGIGGLNKLSKMIGGYCSNNIPFCSFVLCGGMTA